MDKAINKEKTPRIIMITGGQRSGKSVFAENIALDMSTHPTYLATSKVFDEEMRRRVEIHQKRRGSHWRNIEAPLSIEALSFSYNEVVLVDCLTLWATNWMFEKNEDIDKALCALKFQLKLLKDAGVILIVVTNEIGLGGISSNTMQRKFTDLQGLINQYVSSIADEVYMVISGIPVKIKSQR
ncbi:MAG: bifunctional adenosylcobinamide kinase/adenosylcobinamide-phosphate guanylyltransferase [Muribaculaceae bacterium]|nr:bifunctional adenosylcobinamide kinase/adenosylcobinamide-phosphate guanylyltransferase [Muribaculaceae bacterium]